MLVRAGGRGRGCLAWCREPGGLLSWQRENVSVSCGSRPCRCLAQSSPHSSVSTLFSQNAPPPGCLRLLLLRLSSGSPPLGSLPWLPPTLRSRGPSLGGAGCWHLSPGGRWVCYLSLYWEPLAASPPCRGAWSLRRRPGLRSHSKARGCPGVTARCPAKVDSLAGP